MSTQTTIVADNRQHVYVGIDSHKKSWKICIIAGEQMHKPFSQDPEPSILLSSLHRKFPDATYHLAYEAGFAGNWIARWFLDHSVDCIVVNPADIPTTNKDRRQKTDTRDCRKIAEFLQRDTLTALYVPSEQSEDDRQLVRARTALVKKQTRVKNQIKAVLAFGGTPLPDKTVMGHWTIRFIAWLGGLFEDRPSRKQELAVYLEELLWIRQKILAVTRQIRELARSERFASGVALLVSCPGVSTVGAMILLSELIDIGRFASFDRLASYVGLVPSTHSSGESQRTTGITPRSSHALRTLLIESAWVAIRVDPALRAAYDQARKRMANNRAIIIVARKLLSRIYHVLVHKQPYQLNRISSETISSETIVSQRHT